MTSERFFANSENQTTHSKEVNVPPTRFLAINPREIPFAPAKAQEVPLEEVCRRAGQSSIVSSTSFIDGRRILLDLCINSARPKQKTSKR